MSNSHRRSRWALAVSICLLASGAPALAQAIGQGSGPTVSIWRVLIVLLLCLLLAALAALALRYRLRGGPFLPTNLWPRADQARRLELVESLRLSHQVDLCLVAVDGHVRLLAVSNTGVTMLDAPLEAPGSAITVD